TTAVSSATSTTQAPALGRPETLTAGAPQEPATRGLVFAQAQTTGRSQGGNTVARLPDGKSLRFKPGGEYKVPLGTRIFTGGQERLVPQQGGTIRMPDGTVIHVVPENQIETD
ncbi:MAG TPA: hypothetical protein VNO31_41985, partial [Umezawaea sp.]|nr:hypothetical protein [Umezawaea sp.]